MILLGNKALVTMAKGEKTLLKFAWDDSILNVYSSGIGFMAATISAQSIQYPVATVQRARVAFLGTPFHWALLVAMRDRRVALLDLVGEQGITAGYTQQSLSERTAEHYLMWLMRVGMLRREVDGQGLTDSFRLTPLGRQVLIEWQTQGDQQRVSWGASLSNKFRCWCSRFSL